MMALLRFFFLGDGLWWACSTRETGGATARGCSWTSERGTGSSFFFLFVSLLVLPGRLRLSVRSPWMEYWTAFRTRGRLERVDVVHRSAAAEM